MRIVIIFVILLTSLALAANTVKQIKNHTEAVRQSILMLENIEIMLRYRSLTVTEIFQNLSLLQNLFLLSFVKELGKRLYSGGEYESTYNQVLNDFMCTKKYDAEDKNYMNGFLSMLGKSDISGQIANCEMYKELFKTKLLVLENNEDSRCKSNSVLIMGVGIMLSVILI